MATKKAASTKKATTKKPAAASTTTVRTVRADAKPETTVVRPASATTTRSSASALPSNIVNIVFAELVGTFILTLVALATFQETGALYVGLALTVLVMAIGAVSGSHVNPAVTFGVWAMRRLKTVLLPFYWGAQFLGAMLAVIVINWVSNNALNLNFSHVGSLNWSILGCELVAAAVFLFGLAAINDRRDLAAGVRAIGVGLALTAGILVGGTMLAAVKAKDVASYQKATTQSTQQDDKAKQPEIPHSAYVKGVTVNPAVALAVTDRAGNELVASSNESETYSRFTLEVVLGTLLGAALGGNLYLLIAGRRKHDHDY